MSRVRDHLRAQPPRSATPRRISPSLRVRSGPSRSPSR
jgi:hypothetical protein